MPYNTEYLMKIVGFLLEDEITSDESGIIVISGKFGKGKTTLASIFGSRFMRDKKRYQNCLMSIDELEIRLNRKFTRPPQEHCVFANYDIFDGNKKAYLYDIDKFMLPNGEVDYDIFPPWSVFIGDEAHASKLCSYDWSKMERFILFAYSRMRQAHFLAIFNFQIFSNFNKSLRSFAKEYLAPVNIQNEYTCLGDLYKTTLVVGVFYTCEKAEEYEVKQNTELFDEVRLYDFNGNIYEHFDSFARLIDFYRVPPNKDFKYDSVLVTDTKTNKQEEIII